jgi:tetratricopeptide (TPR) repeat protein
MLRRLLGPRVLVSRGNGDVALNPAALECDLWTFESALARGDRAAALAAYHGDLMDGFEVPGAPEFESWLERERLRLRESVTRAAREHAWACQAAGDIEAALWAASIGLALDPADERLVSWSMEVRAEQGDRTAALRAYRDLEVVLRREYGVVPSPETVALRDRLARRFPAAIGSRDATDPTASPVLPPRGSMSRTEADRLYAEGRFFWSKRSRTALERAVECFKQAVSHDPAFPQAFAGLADAYQSLAAYGHVPAVDALTKAKTAAESALALDDALVDSHTSMAGVLALAGEPVRADNRYRQALRLNGRYTPALHWYSTFLRQRGRMTEAYAYISRAMDVDPLSAVVTFTAGTILRSQRDHRRSIELCCRATDLDPSYAPAFYFLACSWAQIGKTPEALTCANRAVLLGGETSMYLAGLAYVLGRAGQRCEAARTLDRLQQGGAHEFHDRALAYIGLGETDCAIECLERAYAAARPVTREPLTDPIFDSLRSQPRFQRLTAKSLRARADGELAVRSAGTVTGSATADSRPIHASVQGFCSRPRIRAGRQED